jgi:hypothetical protein
VSKEARPELEPELYAEMQAVVNRAKGGDAGAVPRLRELMAQFPVLAGHFGDLGKQAETAWVALAAGSDLCLKETLLAHAVAMRAELGGASPSPVERLLVERVIVTWLQVNFFVSIEAQAVGAGESPKVGLYRARRQELANRAHLAALASLAMMRRLLPGPAIEVAARAEATETPAPRKAGRRAGVPVAASPPEDHNRLAGLFERLDEGRANGHARTEPLAAGAVN